MVQEYLGTFLIFPRLLVISSRVCFKLINMLLVQDDSPTRYGEKESPRTFGECGEQFDPETQSGEAAQTEQLKRNLGSRHINMIAIAGMIVSLRCSRLLKLSDVMRRELACS